MTTDHPGYSWDAGSIHDPTRPRGMKSSPEEATRALLAALAGQAAGTIGRVNAIRFTEFNRAHADAGLVCMAEVLADGTVRVLR